MTRLPPGGYFHTKNEIRPVKLQCIKINPHISHSLRRPEHDELSHYAKKIDKITNGRNFYKSWQAAHLLEMVMCRNERDPASVVEDTEWTRFGLQTDGWTDGQTTWNQYNPINFVGGWGVGGGGVGGGGGISLWPISTTSCTWLHWAKINEFNSIREKLNHSNN